MTKAQLKICLLLNDNNENYIVKDLKAKKCFIINKQGSLNRIIKTNIRMVNNLIFHKLIDLKYHVKHENTSYYTISEYGKSLIKSKTHP